MATTREIILEWLKDAERMNASHLIVVCDTFDWSDYPVYVKRDQSVSAVKEKYSNSSMQKVMEVYNVDMPWQPQLEKDRCFQY